jgi:hypothetical protein
MKSSILPLTKWIGDKIATETDYRIYDDHPEQPTYPYIILGAIRGTPWSDKSKPGQTVLATVDFWSQYPGKKEVGEMMGIVLGILTASYPALGSDFNVVFQDMETNQIIIDIDGATRHGILEMRYLVEEL